MKSPYKTGYGLKWPSSGIVSDVYRNLEIVPSLTRAIDFGCGLGGHGRFIETLGFKEVYYIDSDQNALEQSKRFLMDFPSSAERFHFEALLECENKQYDLIVDRASLQHVESTQLISTLDQISLLLSSGDTKEQLSRPGILVSEWIVTAGKGSQTRRFPNVTFFEDIKSFLFERFIVVNFSYHLTQQISENDISEFKVANLVLKPRINRSRVK
jgi:SAM-dependent methyltransferase